MGLRKEHWNHWEKLGIIGTGLVPQGTNMSSHIGNIKRRYIPETGRYIHKSVPVRIFFLLILTLLGFGYCEHNSGFEMDFGTRSPVEGTATHQVRERDPVKGRTVAVAVDGQGTRLENQCTM